MIQLIITCKSTSNPAFYPASPHAQRAEHDETEIIKFTKDLETAFEPQCGLRLRVDGMVFDIHGEAEADSATIFFKASREMSYSDSRITYVRKWRKDNYKKLEDAGWVSTRVVKETARR